MRFTSWLLLMFKPPAKSIAIPKRAFSLVVFYCEKPTNYCVQLSLFMFHGASFCENPKIRISPSPPTKKRLLSADKRRFFMMFALPGK